jgi:hypothetical protein
LDIYNDYLAFGSKVCDVSLTGISACIPYIAVSSLSTGGKYYWAKALTLKIDT